MSDSVPLPLSACYSPCGSKRDPDDLDAESVSMEEVLLGNREIHNRMGRRFPGRRWSLGEALRPSTLRRPRRPRPSVFVVPVTEMMFTSC